MHAYSPRSIWGIGFFQLVGSKQLQVRQGNQTRNAGFHHLGLHTLSPLWPRAKLITPWSIGGRQIGHTTRGEAGHLQSSLEATSSPPSLFVFVRQFRSIAPLWHENGPEKHWVSPGTMGAEDVFSILTDTHSKWLSREGIPNVSLFHPVTSEAQLLHSFLHLTHSARTLK